MLRILFWTLPLVFPIVLFELSLWRAGESTPIESVAEALSEHPQAIFGRQFFDQGHYRFKWISIERHNPSIIALGSSRVMQFRHEMFGGRAHDFFNAGGMTRSISDLTKFIEVLPKNSRIDCVIIGVEYFWFNEQTAGKETNPRSFENAARIDESLNGMAHWHLFQQMLRNWLISDKSSLSWSVLAGAWQGGDTVARNAWGFMARDHRMGFRRDGSFDYGLPAPDDWVFLDREKPEVLARIHNGIREFEPMTELSENLVLQFLSCVQALKNRGITVLCFSPPYPSTAIAALEASPHHGRSWRQYQTELPIRLRQAGAVFVNASTPSVLGMDDECMRDGLHAMETFHLRILKALALDPGAKTVNLDLAHLVRLITDRQTNPWFPHYPKEQ